MNPGEAQPTADVARLVRDRSLRRLLANHWKEITELRWDLASAVAEALPEDSFSISQYLLGPEYFRRRLAAVFSPGERFLDVGCGTGNWCLGAADLYGEVFGVDINEERLAVARRIVARAQSRGEVRLCQAAADHLPFPDAFMDGALCFNVLVFVQESHQDVLREIRRVVKPGGRVYLSVTNGGYLAYLGAKLLARPSVARLHSWATVLLQNARFYMGLVSQPRVSFRRSYVLELAKLTGWRTCHVGLEGDIMRGSQRALYPRQYAGLPFMYEYVLEALA